jgi:hypothetical protein
MADYRASNRDGLSDYTIKIREGNSHSNNNNPPAFVQNVEETFNELKILLLQKHFDYGPKNISESPGGPINGLRVRMWDKLARINNLVDKGIYNPQYESLEDSFKDLANYAIIGLLVLRQQWNSEK